MQLPANRKLTIRITSTLALHAVKGSSIAGGWPLLLYRQRS